MAKHIVFPTPAEQAAVASGADLAAVAHVEEEIPPVPEAALQADPEPEPAPVADLSAFLREELATARHEVEDLKIKLALAEQRGQVEELLAPIVAEATNRLQIALRQSPTNLQGLPASVLAEQYSAMKAQFEKSFPVGQRSLAETDASRVPVDAGEQRLFLVQ